LALLRAATAYPAGQVPASWDDAFALLAAASRSFLLGGASNDPAASIPDEPDCQVVPLRRPDRPARPDERH